MTDLLAVVVVGGWVAGTLLICAAYDATHPSPDSPPCPAGRAGEPRPAAVPATAARPGTTTAHADEPAPTGTGSTQTPGA